MIDATQASNRPQFWYRKRSGSPTPLGVYDSNISAKSIAGKLAVGSVTPLVPTGCTNLSRVPSNLYGTTYAEFSLAGEPQGAKHPGSHTRPPPQLNYEVDCRPMLRELLLLAVIIALIIAGILIQLCR
jgi:hypothetical protein